MSTPPLDPAAPYQGRLGRTLQTSILISSTSGPIFPASLHTGVNVTSHPDLADALASGTLHHVPCPFDPHTHYELALPLHYHDEVNRIFALLLPDALRHEEFKHRSALLGELAKEHDVLPDYVRNFQTVFSLDHLLPHHAPPSPSLDTRSSQLDAVQERLDRERLRMEEIEMRIAAERDELKQERDNYQQAMEEIRKENQRLEALRLNLEQRQHHLDSRHSPDPVERTQVVTDDQLLEIVSDHDDPPLTDAEPLLEVGELLHSHPEPPGQEGQLGQSHRDESDAAALASAATQMTSAPRPPVPRSFDELTPLASSLHENALLLPGDPDGLLAACLISPEQLSLLLDSRPQLFLQYRVLHGAPIFSLLWGGTDDKDQLTHHRLWPIDPVTERHHIQALARRTAIRFAFYDASSRQLLRTLDAHAPLEENARWGLQKADQLLATSPHVKDHIAAAHRALLDPQMDHLGSMRHNFTPHSFSSLQTLSQIKLASGIVGYWSSAMFDHLIGQRSFPLAWFSSIQSRVAAAAYDAGIFLQDDLRHLVVHELGLEDDDAGVLDTLFVHFAERCVGLKPNDLDPLQQWENWEALFELASLLGHEPEQELVELAQTSLRRAQDYQQAEVAMEEEHPPAVASSLSAPPLAPLLTSSSNPPSQLVVAKRSEATGVTYFLPDDAVLDRFDDLHTMNQADLLLLLEDPAGRLEAAQVLLDRFGASVTAPVLQASEKMQTGEIAAIATFLETRSDGLEGPLVRALEHAGPSTIYIVAHALASQKNEDALPTLLGALDDPARQGNPKALAKVLSSYGSNILPSLANHIKSHGPTRHTTTLLHELGKQDPSLLDTWSKDPHNAVRQAAQNAQKSLQSQD